ncbi:MAG: hypothetical protein ACK56X_20575, partial [Planctomyces sp.]
DRLRPRPQWRPDNRVGMPGARFDRIRRHVLVCEDRDNSVIVLTVIHTSMDLPARLLELESRLLTEAQILRARLHGDSSAD